MQNKNLRLILSTVSLLAAGYASSILAHQQSGTLGKPVGATDLYMVTCSTDSGGVSAKLLNSVSTGNAATTVKVSVRTQKGAKATNTTDSINGDTGTTAFSPEVNNVGGDGIYNLTVGKTAASKTPVPYIIDFHCLSSTNSHTGTDIMMLQNQ